jgi:hypothetical protein
MSYAHRNDENNTTPPDIMYPTDVIDSACEVCHESHNVPARDVIARLQERCPGESDPERAICTDCHGRHRLEIRTVRWDKKTGKLLGGDEDSAGDPDAAKSAANMLELKVAGARAFIVRPNHPRPDGSKPWVWYAPSLARADGGWELPIERHFRVVQPLLEKGKGHEVAPEFWAEPRLAEFFLAQAGR